MNRVVELIGRGREARGQIPIEVGIGINTGEVLLGDVGSEERMNFTAIGDVVNIADRLQALALGSEILAGEETARLLGSLEALAARGPTRVKGRANPVLVFELRPRPAA